MKPPWRDTLELRKRIASLEEESKQLRDELQEYEELFQLQETRMTEAVKRWRQENPGNDLTVPDLGKLLTWLLEKKSNE